MLPTLRVKGVGTLKAMQLGQSVGTLPTLLKQCRKCSYTRARLGPYTEGPYTEGPYT